MNRSEKRFIGRRSFLWDAGCPAPLAAYPRMRSSRFRDEPAPGAGGAIPAVAVEENLYATNDGYAVPVPSGSLARVQTPQAFAAVPLLAAYRAAARVGFSGFDTAETMEKFSNVTVGVVEGDLHNIKLTVSDDFAVAEDLARRWEGGRWK